LPGKCDDEPSRTEDDDDDKPSSTNDDNDDKPSSTEDDDDDKLSNADNNNNNDSINNPTPSIDSTGEHECEKKCICIILGNLYVA
jgi:hypothetical protein